MPSRIPAPDYFHESIDGAIYDLPRGNTLVIGTPPDTLIGIAPILSGHLALRYGLPLLAPSIEAVIPGLFVAERGGVLTGREAWDYIMSNFQMHPRADIIGVNSKGTTKQVLLRELDFGLPVRIFAYPDESIARIVQPAIELTAVLADGTVPRLPDLASRYLALISAL
jgi:hypothetical protein